MVEGGLEQDLTARMIEILLKSFSLTTLAKHCRQVTFNTRMPSELWDGSGRLLLARSSNTC